MTLYVKLALQLFAVLLASTLTEFIVNKLIIQPSFIRLEEQEAHRNLVRTQQAVQREIDFLNNFVHDWAAWDDTYQFIKDKNEQYLTRNVDGATMVDMKLNVMHFYTTDLKLVIHREIDTETGEPMALKGLPNSDLTPDNAFVPVQHHGISLRDLTTKGLISVNGKPFVVSMRPILKSDNEGPVAGYLMMGRFLDIEKIKEQTQIELSVYRMDGVQSKHDDSCPDAYESTISGLSKDQMRLCSYMHDIYNNNTFVTQIEFPREISKQGFKTLPYAISITATSVILLLILLFVALNKTVVKPIYHLASHASEIASSNDYSRRLNLKRRDMIGELADSFDAMMQQIELQNQKLAELNDDLVELSSVDALSGLFNRRVFDQTFRDEWLRLRRENQPLGLILCDIDHFKQYNDNYGHRMGDDCIKRVAEAIEISVRRPADFAARYGGEEFAVLLPNTDLKGVSVVAENIRLKVESLQLKHEHSFISPYVTISIGGTSVIPKGAGPAAVFFETADKSLYNAKESGRNCARVKDCPLLPGSIPAADIHQI